jgi:hypothetical protein
LGSMREPGPSSQFERRQSRLAWRQAAPAALTLVASELVVASLDLDAGSTWWHVAVSLLPLIPAVCLVWVQWLIVRRADEFQRTAHLEALAVGFGVAMLAALTGGLLDAADVGSNAQWLQITFIGGVLAWVTALAVRLRP